jgi:formate/nitrite transporter FocA (FNT family)
VLKDYLASPIYAIFAFPVLFILSVVVQYLFILGEVYPPRKIDQWLMWTIMASICGNILGIAIVAWFSRVKEALSSAPSRR